MFTPIGEPPERRPAARAPEVAAEGKDADPSARGSLTEDSLEKAFNWAAGGFALLTGLLGFFGIKEGVLDQALRLYAPATLCIFIFLGIGIVAGLFAYALDFAIRLRLWVLVVALILMLVVASVYFPDMADRQSIQPFDHTLWDSTRPWLVGALLVGLLVSGLVALPKGPGLQKAYTTIIAPFVVILLVVILLPRRVDPSTRERKGIDWQRLTTIGLAGALLLAALCLLGWALVKMVTLPIVAGLMVVAVTATSFGLYGATKLALESKSLSISPQVTAAVKSADGATSVSISVKAGHYRGLKLSVELMGTPRGQAQRTPEDAAHASEVSMEARSIWSTLLSPDGLDEIDQAFDVPVSPTRWSELSVRYCSRLAEKIDEAKRDKEAEKAKDAKKVEGPGCGEGDARPTVVSVRNPSAESGFQQLNAQISPSGEGKLHATFEATDVAPGSLTKVELCRGRGKHLAHVTDATIAPNSQGELSWEATVPAGAVGDRLVLRHMSCPAGKCDVSWRQLASYVNE
ncbi:hypothetical protein [Phycicoccus sp. Soil803]|uniref:hypothetical protein n=1 Tax=Phycicoccus sp. Soil803 TaxID=1736415 RepID=UPI0012FC9CFF|nr:hypothetical protein [Phycicoccus sp. Soil803]